MLRLVAFLFLASGAAAQVPTPEAFLGYTLGERFTPHHRVIDYVGAVAEASPRVTMETYGESVEGRPLVTLTVAAEGVDVEAVRASRLSSARGAATPLMPVVWLSYNVHGNESVSTEAAMATLYRLASGDPAETGLDRVVVIMDPCLNPDGRERYVSGFRQRVGARVNAAPEAWEHDESWPGGRFNHYLFDLNRDWAWGTQPETRARLAVYQRWLPSVHVDFHEQGVDSPYYFAPGAEPFHAAITPWQRELQDLIGDGNARAFDADGRLYFTREVFDLLYPGYGDTWPTFNGAVGMTYEQGGSGRAGLAIVTAEGDTLTLADRIANHRDTGLATVATTAANAERVSREFADYFARGTDASGVTAYVVRGSADRMRALVDLLILQSISYQTATERQTVSGLAYAGGRQRPAREPWTVEPGEMVIPLDQPQGALAKVLFEPEPALADSLTYDVTAWALPYVYGLDAMETSGSVASLTPAPSPSAPFAGGPTPYAYVLPWDGPRAAAAVAGLLRDGVSVRVAPEAFEVDGERFARGARIVTRAGNEGMGRRFDEAVQRAARGQRLVALSTGRAASGADLGSNRVGFVGAPVVAALTESPVSPTALGEVWSLFDQTWAYPLTLLGAGSFSTADLDDVDVLILPDGGYGSWLSEDRAKDLRDWVRAGGRLIAMEGAAQRLAGREGFGLTARKAPAADTSAASRLRRYEDSARTRASGDTPGAVYRVQLDDSHPLAYGYPDWMYVLKRDASPYDFLASGWNVGVVRSGTPAAGFAGTVAQERLEDSLVFGVENMGRGEVVYLLDSPLFRGFWRDGELLFANAVFGLGAE